MGIFDGKTKIHVSASVSPLFENPGPSLMDQVIANSLMGTRDFVDELLERTVHSTYNNFENYFRYGESGYVRGLPTVEVSDNEIDTAHIIPAIKKDTGRDVTLQYVKLDTYHPAHFVWTKLVREHGYDHKTNKLNGVTTPSGKKAYLHDLSLHLPSDISTEYPWADNVRLQTPAREVPGFSTYEWTVTKEDLAAPIATVKYAYEKSNGVPAVSEFIIDVSTALRDVQYLMVYYTYIENNSVKHDYWEYRPGAGSHPALDDINQLNGRYLNIGEFYPTGIFMSQGNDLTQDEATDLYTSTAELFRRIGLDYADLGKNITDNPDSDKIQQAVLQLGVPITTQDEMGMRYLFEFFDGIYEKVVDKTVLQPTSASLNNVGKYRFTFKEGSDYEFTLVLGDVFRRTVPGSLGKIGTCTNESGKIPVALGSAAIDVDARIIRKQVTAGIYQEITVLKPSIAFRVYKSKSEWASHEDDRLLIPVDRTIVKDFKPTDRDALLRHSLHVVVTAMEKQHIKWYQTKTFRFILVVAAVIITVASGGTTSQTLAAAWAAGTTAFVLALLEIILTIIVTQLAIQEIGKRVSPQLALILAIVAFAIGAGTDGMGGLEASQFLHLSSNLVQVSMYANQYEMAELMDDLEDLRDLEKERNKELDEVRKLLDTGIELDPLRSVKLQPMIIMNESPDSFFQRTVHAGNIGTVSIEYIHHYVDESLKLPGINTLNGIDFDYA